MEQAATLAPWLQHGYFRHSWVIRQATFQIITFICLFSVILIIYNKLSDESELESRYYVDPDACDLSELMVVENVVSGHKDIIALFWENKLGIDIDVCILPLKYLALVYMIYRIIIVSSCSRDRKA